MLKTPAKKAGGGITLAFDSMTGVTLHTGTPGWKVYTISSTSAMTRTITATVASDTSINIVVCGGGGGAISFSNNSGGGGGGRFREVQKFIPSSSPTQTFTCTIPARATGLQVGGTSSITFSVPSIGDISCGGGGCGSYTGGSTSNAPVNGGSGGGGGATTSTAYSGGTGVYKGGSGFVYYGQPITGGGGGAGGNGGNAGAGVYGVGGLGVSTTLAGISLVYTSSYQFCQGGYGQGSSNGTLIGQGGTGIASGSPHTTAGGPGAIIIAVPA